MRIRRSAARLLGSTYTASVSPPPDAAPPFELPLPAPPPPPPCSEPPESRGGGGFSLPVAASGEPCELSRSPWDLIAELSLSDPQVEDDLVDMYFVHVACRASWLFSATMPVPSAKKVKPACEVSSKKAPKKTAASREAKKKAKVKKEETAGGGGARVWKCKKNDGKGWHCNRTVSRPNTLCDYHSDQKLAYSNPELELSSAVEPEVAAPAPAPVPAAKSATSSKPRKKKPASDFNATEGFYYYTGFGPFRSKRYCRSGGTNEPPPVPAKQQEEGMEQPPEPEEDSSPNQSQVQADVGSNRVAGRDDEYSCDENDVAGIAGLDEESSEDDGVGVPGSNAGANGEHRVGNGDGSKRTTPWKRWRRKPVKARSLKSLM